MLCTSALLASAGYALQNGANPNTINQAINSGVQILQDYADALNQSIQQINATLQTNLDAQFYALQKPFDYVVASSSPYYTLQNGTTGALNDFNTNQTAIESEALGNLSSSGGTVFLKDLQHNSSLSISGPIQVFETYNGNFQVYEPFNVSVVVTVGDVLFLNTTGLYCEANATSSSTMPGVLLVAGNASAYNYTLCLKSGILTYAGWSWTIGQYVYVGNSTALSQTYPSASGSIVEIVGYALTATSICFEPVLAPVKIT